MKKLFLVTALAVTPYLCANAANNDARDYCSKLQPSFNQLNKQFPKEIDFMTTLIGVSATVIGEVCEIRYEYILSEENLLKVYIQEEFSENEAIEHVNSKEAVDEMINGLKSSFPAEIKKAALKKHVSLTARYRYDGDKLKGFEIKL